MPRLCFIFLLSFLGAHLGGCSRAHAAESGPGKGILTLCPEGARQIQLAAPIEPGLAGNEQRLVCGDSDGTHPVSHAWRIIPRAQAKYHLQTFLQERGYFRPKITWSSDADDASMQVDPGPVTYVSSLEAIGAPEQLDLDRKREIVHEKLTPKLLDRLEKWIEGRLQTIGYPCSALKTLADETSGKIVVRIEPGPKLNLKSILEQPLAEIGPGILRRYDAFEIGEPFNRDLLTLTERRALAKDVVESIHFRVGECAADGVTVIQEGTEGKPRLLIFGFGADTEGLVRAKATWRNTRVGKNASLIDVTGIGSSKLQEIRTSADWYYLPFPTRQYLHPLLDIRHENEQPFELISTRLQVGPARDWDTQNFNIRAQAGPAYDLIRTLRGPGSPSTKFLSLDTELRFSSHYFEFHTASPRAGFSAFASGNFNSRNFFSDATAHRLRVGGQALINYKNYDPPLWVIGLRGEAATTLTDAVENSSILPPGFKYFLGGSTDLRGFGRNELSVDGNGGLSSAFGGMELRLARLLPLGMEPLLFGDLGALGQAPLTLDNPLFWSPGFGIRWESPIGVFRTTLSHGYLIGPRITGADQLSHLQFYLSYGEEF